MWICESLRCHVYHSGSTRRTLDLETIVAQQFSYMDPIIVARLIRSVPLPSHKFSLVKETQVPCRHLVLIPATL